MSLTILHRVRVAGVVNVHQPGRLKKTASYPISLRRLLESLARYWGGESAFSATRLRERFYCMTGMYICCQGDASCDLHELRRMTPLPFRNCSTGNKTRLDGITIISYNQL